MCERLDDVRVAVLWREHAGHQEAAANPELIRDHMSEKDVATGVPIFPVFHFAGLAIDSQHRFTVDPAVHRTVKRNRLRAIGIRALCPEQELRLLQLGLFGRLGFLAIPLT